MNFSPPVYAKGLHDVGIKGKGSLDAQGLSEGWVAMVGDRDDPKALREDNQKGKPVKDRIYGLGKKLRPNFVEFFECDRVLLEGIEIKNSPMWSVHPVLCKGFHAKNVTIWSAGVNNDGIDPDMSTDVLIEGCSFQTSDDGVAIKAGRDADGRKIAKKTERVVVMNCKVLPNKEAEKHGEGARNGMAIGSEGSAGVN